MNARLLANVLRPRPEPKPAQSFVPSMLDHFDRMEPTRSRELKPSQRLRIQRDTRRILRRTFACLALAVACLAVLTHFAH